MTENCQNCMYFYSSESQCLRYPPQVFVMTVYRKMTADDGSYDTKCANFPTVEPDDWCGEFKTGITKEEMRG